MSLPVFWRNILDNSKWVEKAEINLLAVLLQHPDKSLLDLINIEAAELTYNNHAALFLRVVKMLRTNTFDINVLVKEFSDLQKYLTYEDAKIDKLPAYVSYIKTGMDLSKYHIRHQLTEYKTVIDLESKKPLSERVLKPNLVDVARAIGGYYFGELSVLAAQPGLGKSSLSLQEAVDFGTPKRPTVYIIHEMTAHRQIDRMMANAAENLLFQELIELTYVNDPVKQKDWLRAFGELHRNEIYIVGSNKENDFADWKNLKKLILHFLKLGVRFFTIDSINLMSWSEVNAQSRNYEMEYMIRDILKVCTNADLGKPHIRLVAHVNREVEKTSDKRPRLNHLGDSSGLGKWVDLAQFIYRDAEGEEPSVAEIYALKNRNADTPGIARVFWDGAKFRFRNLQSSTLI